MAVEQYTNFAQTTLNGGINNSVTSLIVTSATTFPAGGQFRILIDAEILLVTAVSSNTFTVTRGAEGSSAASHLTGALVTHVLTAGSVQNSQGQNIVTVSGTNTLTCTLPGSPTTIPTGPFWILIANTNSGAVTLNPNSIGAQNLLNPAGAALVAGQLVVGQIYMIVFVSGSFLLISSPSIAPQMSFFASGTAATFSTPSGCKLLIIRAEGAGAGGVTGGGTAPVVPTAGGDTTATGTGIAMTAGGGAIGSGATGGVGGTASGGDINISGNRGRVGTSYTVTGYSNSGGDGGDGAWGSGGAKAEVGTARAGLANTGGGGAGGGTASGTAAGGGGGGGAYCEKWIANPPATVTYTVGVGGNGGTSTAGNFGGAGGSGWIMFECFF